MTVINFMDGYCDVPRPGTCEALLQERNRVRMLTWQDPADRELREELERLEAELAVLDRGGSS
jgi:hypothetical protein